MKTFTKKLICQKRGGVVLIISMIFLMIFSALTVSLATLSNASIQIPSNHHRANSALSAAESGLECGKYLIASATFAGTGDNDISDAEANIVWTTLCQHVQATALSGQAVSAATNFTDSTGSGDQIVTQAINFGDPNTNFVIRFYRYDSDPRIIKLQSTGTTHGISKKVNMSMEISKESEVLKYAAVSKSRVIITGDSTIEGDLYSTWTDTGTAPPFTMSSESTVNGTLGTAVSEEDWSAEEVESDVLGEHSGVLYDQSNPDLPGMDYTDYDTSSYKSATTEIADSGTTVREYFPHQPGDYSSPEGFGSRRLDRKVYENQTFTDAMVPENSDALFKNCTFEGLLFIETDPHVGWRSNYNNVRFEDCNFNGSIVTDVPDDFSWKNNVLYFTGSATFNNEYMEEATILAPNFNVNIGNTQELIDQSESVLTGLVVGGIVDVRGNANINGTILSMFDPSNKFSSGSYATNVGFSDENSESGIPEDIGTIHIRPAPDMLLPSGIITPIVIKPLQGTYSEN